MTSQITARSWNYILKTHAMRTGAIPSGPVRHYNSRHVYRNQINPQECSHKRKNCRELFSRQQHSLLRHGRQLAHQRAAESTSFVLCNHNLNTFSSSTTTQPLLANMSPCGHCNILGEGYSVVSGLIAGSEWRKPTSGLTPEVVAGSDLDDDISDPRTCSILNLTTGHTGNYPMAVGNHHHGYHHTNLSTHQTLTGLARQDANWVVIRSFHTAPRRLEEAKSKVEEVVKALKMEVEEKVKQAEASETTVGALSSAMSPEPVKAVVQKKSIGQRIMAELKHYYHGFRLLFIDMKLCSRYLLAVLMGRNLNRRERRQLVRTTADLFRLVPFLVFLIVPFMEFLLPVAVKLFPGMLPSTFSEEKKEQEALRKKLKGKLEMAKFLQDTLEEMAIQKKGADESHVHEFTAFLKRIRSSDEQTTNEEIIKYSKLFKDEITLDSLQHAQLTALSKLVDLQTIGTNAFLRFQLRMKLRQLEADDRMIKKEGLDTLTVWELQEACRMRGMRSLGVSTQRLQLQLQQWLDLHLENQVPASLLLLSRTLYLPSSVATEEVLKATLSTLPETTDEEAKVRISEVAGERVDNKTKLEIIRQEEAAILEEKKQTEEEEKAVAKKKEEEELTKVAAAAAATAQEAIKTEVEPIPAADVPTPVSVSEAATTEPLTPAQVAATTGVYPEEVLVDKAVELEQPKTEEIVPEPVVADVEEPISVKELEEVEEALEAVSDERRSMKIEKEELDALKEDVTEYKENLADLKEVVVASGVGAEFQESKAAKRLSKQVYKMVKQMDKLMGGLQDDKDLLTEEIEVREVRIKRSKELQEDESMRQQVLDQISSKKENLIGINELLLSMKRLQKISDDTKFQRIMEVLDEDKDGKIDIDDALRVIDLLGQENVKVSGSKMAEILDLLRKEAQLEEDTRREKDANKVNADTGKTDGPTPPPEEILEDITNKARDESKQS